MTKKRLAFCIVLATMLMAGCRGDVSVRDSASGDSVFGTLPAVKEFKTTTVHDKFCLVIYYDDPVAPEFDTVGAKCSYSLAWPQPGMMTDEAMRELLVCYFNDSTATDITAAAAGWRKSLQGHFGGKPVPSIDENRPYSESVIQSTCRQDSNIATFSISFSDYEVGAAHGLYGEQYVTVDVESGQIIHLADLIDTTHLGKALARAIQDLEVNKEVRECLFDEFRNSDEMPVTLDFFLDSTLSTINVVYGLYHIAPYACGIQTVVLPVFWLSKHLRFTPYAKRLFGPGSYVE